MAAGQTKDPAAKPPNRFSLPGRKAKRLAKLIDKVKLLRLAKEIVQFRAGGTATHCCETPVVAASLVASSGSPATPCCPAAVICQLGEAKMTIGTLSVALPQQPEHDLLFQQLDDMLGDGQSFWEADVAAGPSWGCTQRSRICRDFKAALSLALRGADRLASIDPVDQFSSSGPLLEMPLEDIIESIFCETTSEYLLENIFGAEDFGEELHQLKGLIPARLEAFGSCTDEYSFGKQGMWRLCDMVEEDDEEGLLPVRNDDGEFIEMDLRDAESLLVQLNTCPMQHAEVVMIEGSD